MKKIIWKKIDFFLLVATLTLIIFSIPTLSMHQNKGQMISQFDLITSDFSWNTSDYINFHGPLINVGFDINFRIYINDEDPAYNWSKTKAENDWCSGSGTTNDPYIIENLYIKGNGSGGMIYIKWSTEHFIIRNCWFDYSGPNESDVGVCIHHAENGIVERNIFSYTYMGIAIQLACYNITADNNIMISDHTTAGKGRGVGVSGQCDNITISKNRIRNYWDAMYIMDSNNISINGNYAENNIWGADYTGYPVGLSQVFDSELVYNVLAGAFAKGSFLINEVSCSGNIVENNTVLIGDTWDFGPPELSGTLSLSIPSPKLQQSTENLISLDHSDNNYIAHNIMLRSEPLNGAINSYDIFLVVGTVSLVSILLFVVIRKKTHKKDNY